MGEMVTKAKTGCDSSSKRQYYLGFFFRMVVFVILLTIIIFIFGTVFTRKFWLPDLLENFVYVSCSTFFCALILRGLYDRISPFSRLLFFMIFTVLAVIGVGLGLVAGSFILEGKWSGNVDFLFALGIGVFASIGVTFYEVQKSKLEENIIRLKDVEVENEQLKRIESEARFNTLQAKLNPHFLFNALNSAAELIYEDPKKAESSLLRLSDLYRRILSISDKTYIRVQEEIDLIEDLFELEMFRFGERLVYSIECPEFLRAHMIPGLLVEPLVENVIKHGSDSGDQKISVTVRLSSEEEDILIEVADTGSGFDTAKTSYGFGLYSIQERLRLLYGENYTLDVSSEQGRGTQVRLRFPAKAKLGKGDVPQT